MAQHVGMDWEGHASALAQPHNERVEALRRDRATAL